jgi:hypothetical protein
MPGMIERLRWPVDRIRREREDRLRDLLRVVKERSPWHRERLRAPGSRDGELARLGVPSPCVGVRVVQLLERQATGKMRRFVPLP